MQLPVVKHITEHIEYAKGQTHPNSRLGTPTRRDSVNRPPSSYVRIRREFQDSSYAFVRKTQVSFYHRLGLLL
jgi:hypothetical protein